MREDFHAEEELSLSDIFRALYQKAVILIAVLVLGCVLGGAIGYFSSRNVYEFGVSPEFYVNPYREQSYVTCPNCGLKEIEIKKDEARVPCPNCKEMVESNKNNTTTTQTSQYGVYGAYGKHVMENIVKLLSSEKFSEELMEGMEGVPANKYLDAEKTKLNPEWKAFLKKVNSSVHFAYVQSTDTADAELSRSFIYVDILVEGKENKDFAKELLTQIEAKVPAYVEENMVVPSDYDGTNCRKTSVLDEVERTNAGYAKRQAIKLALLIGAAVFVIACVVVVVLQRMDNRLRHYETVSKNFDVPVLGVLPMIEKRKGEDKK